MRQQETHGSRNVVLSKKFFYSQRLPNVDIAGLVQVFGEVDYDVLDQFHFLCMTKISFGNLFDNSQPSYPIANTEGAFEDDTHPRGHYVSLHARTDFPPHVRLLVGERHRGTLNDQHRS